MPSVRIVPTVVAVRPRASGTDDVLPIAASPPLSDWHVALVTMVTMIRNIVLSALIAFLAAFLTSRGNVFLVVSPALQSRAEYIAASLLWGNGLAFVVMTLVLTLRLTSIGRQSFCHWFMCLTPILLLPFAVTVVALVGLVWVCEHVVPPRLDYLRIEYYISAFMSQAFFAACDARALSISHQDSRHPTETEHNFDEATH